MKCNNCGTELGENDVFAQNVEQQFKRKEEIICKIIMEKCIIMIDQLINK